MITDVDSQCASRRFAAPEIVPRVEISPERSQSIDFVVEGANHLDLLYGKAAEELIHPLLIRAIRQAWSGWRYPKERQAA